MQAPDMGIVALHEENRNHLSGIEIFDFKGAYDWRWRDPQDSSERLTAFPGWQPWLYRFMLLVNYCAFGAAILAVVLPIARPPWQHDFVGTVTTGVKWGYGVRALTTLVSGNVVALDTRRSIWNDLKRWSGTGVAGFGRIRRNWLPLG